MDQGGALWGFALIGGPILLFLALAWGRLKAGRKDDQVDRVRASTDPSHGMTGAGVSPDTAGRGGPSAMTMGIIGVAVLLVIVLVVYGFGAVAAN